MYDFMSYWLEVTFDVMAIPAFFLAAGISIDSIANSSNKIISILTFITVTFLSWVLGWKIDGLTHNDVRFFELLLPLIGLGLCNFIAFYKNRTSCQSKEY